MHDPGGLAPILSVSAKSAQNHPWYQAFLSLTCAALSLVAAGIDPARDWEPRRFALPSWRRSLALADVMPLRSSITVVLDLPGVENGCRWRYSAARTLSASVNYSSQYTVSINFTLETLCFSNLNNILLSFLLSQLKLYHTFLLYLYVLCFFRHVVILSFPL